MPQSVQNEEALESQMLLQAQYLLWKYANQIRRKNDVPPLEWYQTLDGIALIIGHAAQQVRFKVTQQVVDVVIAETRKTVGFKGTPKVIHVHTVVPADMRHAFGIARALMRIAGEDPLILNPKATGIGTLIVTHHRANKPQHHAFIVMGTLLTKYFGKMPALHPGEVDDRGVALDIYFPKRHCTYRQSLAVRAQRNIVDPAKLPRNAVVTAEIHRLVNLFRREHDLPPYRFDADLVPIALAHCEDLFQNGSDPNVENSAHYRLHTKGPGDRLNNARPPYRYFDDAENIARTRVPRNNKLYAQFQDPLLVAKWAVEEWMNSTKGHRESLLMPNATEQGIGVLMKHKEEMLHVVITQIMVG